jgi:hypothetical protein
MSGSQANQNNKIKSLREAKEQQEPDINCCGLKAFFDSEEGDIMVACNMYRLLIFCLAFCRAVFHFDFKGFPSLSLASILPKVSNFVAKIKHCNYVRRSLGSSRCFAFCWETVR